MCVRACVYTAYAHCARSLGTGRNARPVIRVLLLLLLRVYLYPSRTFHAFFFHACDGESRAETYELGHVRVASSSSRTTRFVCYIVHYTLRLYGVSRKCSARLHCTSVFPCRPMAASCRRYIIVILLCRSLIIARPRYGMLLRGRGGYEKKREKKYTKRSHFVHDITIIIIHVYTRAGITAAAAHAVYNNIV